MEGKRSVIRVHEDAGGEIYTIGITTKKCPEHQWCRDQDFYLYATEASNLPWGCGEHGGAGAADRPGPDNKEATAEINGI